MTIDEALDGFVRDEVEALPVTPRASYARTVRLLAFWLERDGVPGDAPLDALAPEHLRRFVAWHATSGMADDADASRKAAQHVARLGAHLAGRAGRADLALDRDALRGIVGG